MAAAITAWTEARRTAFAAEGMVQTLIYWPTRKQDWEDLKQC